jgi:hypothetical protein
MLVAAVAVLAGVIAVALGRGGELAFFPGDYAPLKLDEIAATDVVLFRPPMAAWGYSVQATDEALNRIAGALTERDIEITTLRQQVADLEATSPAGGRRGYGLPGRNDRPGLPVRRPASGLPPASRDERPFGPQPPAGPPPDASGAGIRSFGPRPPVGPPPEASGAGMRSPGSRPPVGPPPGAAGPGTRDAQTPGPGGDQATRPAASSARDPERFSPGDAAPPGHQPATGTGTDQPPAPADGEG